MVGDRKERKQIKYWKQFLVIYYLIEVELKELFKFLISANKNTGKFSEYLLIKLIVRVKQVSYPSLLNDICEQIVFI